MGFPVSSLLLRRVEGEDQEAARVLADVFRSSDVTARLGPDEFCVVLSGASDEGRDVAVSRLGTAAAGAGVRFAVEPLTLEALLDRAQADVKP